jgi:hypothetical protein
MKKSMCLVLCLLLVSITAAFAKKNKGSDFNGATLVSSTIDETVLTFEINSYDFKKVKTPRGNAAVLAAPNTGTFLEKGAPALLKLSAAIIIPDEAKMQVEVIDSDFTEIRNIDIAPSKGNLLRTVDPDTVPYEYGPEYQVDGFYPGTLAEPGSPYIIRDFRGQAIIVYPFQYNPVTNVLRVYNRVTVKISPTGEWGENIFNRREALRSVDPAFNNVYASHFLNYPREEYTPLQDDIGNYLIICYTSFTDEMADFVSWKESIGYNVDLVNYSTIGSSSALKTYVSNYYNSNGLTFLLLVGDHAQVPTSSTSAGDSDNNYGYIVGSDHYLDIFVGRFSAETAAHVTTQVNRTIHYERDVLSSAAWFRHAIGMGSSEGPGHHGEYDYQHINYILDDLEDYGYTTHTCHQSGGSPTLMTSLINNGAGTIFYCGHGTITSWYFSSWQYTSSHVDALVNDNELPFIHSVACVVGNFKNYTCFCETWLRATHNGVPTGAVAHAGSTINQSWSPPMDAQDETADLLVSTLGPKRTFGGVFVNGLFKMIDLNGSGGESMADTWTCFGDASVQLRTPGTPVGPGTGFNAEDLVVRSSDARLWLRPLENGIFGAPKQVGHGWNFTHYFAGHWNNDYPTHDLIVRDSSGNMRLYPYRNETFYTYGSIVVGQNFNYTHYFVGNWTDNGTDDLIVRDSNGYLWLFPYVEDVGFGTGTNLGGGWNYTHYFVGNWSGNGTPDLICRDSSGYMWYYRFDNGTFASRKKVGNGWYFTHYFVGNWTGDGTDDLIVRDSSGNMRLYPFRNESFYYVPGAGTIVAAGWNFTDYFVGDWKDNDTDDMIVRDSSGNMKLYPFENNTFQAGTTSGTGFNYTHYFVGQWTDDN